ncbi:MAG: SLC13 family permease [Planctomycetota bacterium]|nr:SLC13 family permease [Planctomycetota bacterium]
MDSSQLIVLATLAVALVLFITDALRYEVISVGVAVILAATRVLEPEEAFSGFSSPAVFLVAAMYVFGAAFTRWGVTESIGQRFLGGTEQSERMLVFRIVMLSGLLSSFLSNAGVVAILIPVLGTLSRETKIPASRLFMPLAYGSLLGGLVTLIGTSKNLAVNAVLVDCNAEPFGLFDFSLLGICLLSIGGLYFLGPGLYLLPKKREEESLTEHYHVREFVTEMLVKPSSTLINRTVGDVELLKDHGVSVLGIARPDSSVILAPGAYNRIQADDTLILQGEPDAILAARKALDLQSADPIEVGGSTLQSADVALVEAIIPPGSSLLGRSLNESEYQAHSSLNVIALSKGGELQSAGIRQLALEVGDTLLIQGHLRDIERAKRDREIVILEQKKLQPIGRGGLLTVSALVIVLLVSLTGVMDIWVAALAGALFLVAARVIAPNEVHQAIDWTALIMIGGMLALGKAFQHSGLADEVAIFISAFGGSGAFGGPHLILALFLVVTGLLTQLTTHIAAAVIMAPIAVSTAAGMSIGDRPFLMAVLASTTFAFMSPVAHQANTMVMGPGDYRYKDFLRAGTPLTILEYIAAFFLIPVFFPFGG